MCVEGVCRVEGERAPYVSIAVKLHYTRFGEDRKFSVNKITFLKLRFPSYQNRLGVQWNIEDEMVNFHEGRGF